VDEVIFSSARINISRARMKAGRAPPDEKFSSRRLKKLPGQVVNQTNGL
jgi:hypothetical protein